MNKPISRPLHGLIDYHYAVIASAAPRLAGFQEEQTAANLARAVGGSVMLYSLFTSYERGLVKEIPYKTHLMLDFVGGVASLAMPWLFGFAHNTRARNTFLALGAFSVAASLLSEADEMR